MVREDWCHKTAYQQYLKSYAMAEEEGARVQKEMIPGFEAAMSAAFTLTLVQASEIHHERLAENPDGFGADVRAFLEQGYLISGVDYVRAQRIRTRLVDEALKLFERVDVFILPTTPNPATRIGQAPDPLNALLPGRLIYWAFPPSPSPAD